MNTDTKPKTDTKVSVPLSEDFQRNVIALLDGCSEQECEFIQSYCSKRRNEIYTEKSPEDTTSEEFSDEDMPS